MTAIATGPAPLPAGIGVSFKPQHFPAIIAGPQPVAYFEIHAENYLGAGGTPHAQLGALRERYPLSIHGVGLSIGRPAPLDRDHLDRVARLCRRYRPESFSEHLAWSSHGGVFFNDLLPLPYTAATLARVTSHIDQVQTALGRQMLLENPATYLAFAESRLAEGAFLREVARRTGCGLLLDVNNLYIAAVNAGRSALDDLAAFPVEHAGALHLAGHDRDRAATPAAAPLLIDAHGSPVAPSVMALYAAVLARTGAVATLVEWDNDVPDWPVLLDEAARAGAVLAQARPDRLERVA